MGERRRCESTVHIAGRERESRGERDIMLREISCLNSPIKIVPHPEDTPTKLQHPTIS
jgi:hypothetical protein